MAGDPLPGMSKAEDSAASQEAYEAVSGRKVTRILIYTMGHAFFTSLLASLVNRPQTWLAACPTRLDQAIPWISK